MTDLATNKTKYTKQGGRETELVSLLSLFLTQLEERS